MRRLCATVHAYMRMYVQVRVYAGSEEAVYLFSFVLLAVFAGAGAPRSAAQLER